MSVAYSTPNSQTEQKSELLSVRALLLAERVAGLIERTLDLYEAELVVAEANPAVVETPVEEHDAAPVSATPKVTRARTGGIPLLTSIQRLVRSMESLLRIARFARELETRACENDEKSFMDPVTIRRLLSETE